MKKELPQIITSVLAALFILWVLFGCSEGFHARRALKKGFTVVNTDTIIRVDTVWRIVERVDTVFKYQFDTVTYYQDSIQVVYFYNTVDSTVYIEVDCPDCPEVFTEVIIENTAFVPEKPKGVFFKVWTWLKVNFWIAITVLIGIGVLSVLRRLKIL